MFVLVPNCSVGEIRLIGGWFGVGRRTRLGLAPSTSGTAASPIS